MKWLSNGKEFLGISHFTHKITIYFSVIKSNSSKTCLYAGYECKDRLNINKSPANTLHHSSINRSPLDSHRKRLANSPKNDYFLFKNAKFESSVAFLNLCDVIPSCATYILCGVVSDVSHAFICYIYVY